MNDVSAREVQTEHKQWYFGKSLDGFTPLGPCIMTADSTAFPPVLKIQSKVNGELRQNSNTGLFIHGIEEVICELTQGMTLKQERSSQQERRQESAWDSFRRNSLRPGMLWSVLLKESVRLEIRSVNK